MSVETRAQEMLNETYAARGSLPVWAPLTAALQSLRSIGIDAELKMRRLSYWENGQKTKPIYAIFLNGKVLPILGQEGWKGWVSSMFDSGWPKNPKFGGAAVDCDTGPMEKSLELLGNISAGSHQEFERIEAICKRFCEYEAVRAATAPVYKGAPRRTL